MRIHIGGSKNNKNKDTKYHFGVSLDLGPVGSMIVSVFLMLVGIFVVVSCLGFIPGILMGLFVVAIGVYSFISNIRKIKK